MSTVSLKVLVPSHVLKAVQTLAKTTAQTAEPMGSMFVTSEVNRYIHPGELQGCFGRVLWLIFCYSRLNNEEPATVPSAQRNLYLQVPWAAFRDSTGSSRHDGPISDVCHLASALRLSCNRGVFRTLQPEGLSRYYKSSATIGP